MWGFPRRCIKIKSSKKVVSVRVTGNQIRCSDYCFSIFGRAARANSAQGWRIIDICHVNSKGESLRNWRIPTIRHTIFERIFEIFGIIMGIANLISGNILLGKGVTGGKINGHVIVCSKIPVIACG